MKKTLAVAALVGALTLTGCSAGNQSQPIDSPKATGPAAAKVGKPTEPDGSRAKPYAAGTKALLSKGSIWTVGFQPATLDATAIVTGENPYNEIVEGSTPVLAPVTLDVKENGGQDISEGVDLMSSLTFEFVTASGRAYGSSGNSYCGVIPDDLTQIGTLYSGATATGNVCAQVPTGDIAGGEWSVSNGVKKLFFAVQ